MQLLPIGLQPRGKTTQNDNPVWPLYLLGVFAGDHAVRKGTHLPDGPNRYPNPECRIECFSSKFGSPAIFGQIQKSGGPVHWTGQAGWEQCPRRRLPLSPEEVKDQRTPPAGAFLERFTVPRREIEPLRETFQKSGYFLQKLCAADLQPLWAVWTTQKSPNPQTGRTGSRGRGHLRVSPRSVH